jgi:hypothetical protein
MGQVGLTCPFNASPTNSDNSGHRLSRNSLFSNGYRRLSHGATGSGIERPQKFGESEVGAVKKQSHS